MKVIQRRLENGHFLLDATASAKEVTEAFDKAQILFANKMALRAEPGKTPAQAALEQLGIKDLDSVVAADVPEYLWPFAVEQRNLHPAYPPKPQSQDVLRRGKDYNFQFEICPKAKYELSNYDPITIEAPAFEPDLSSVEKTLDELAERYMELVPDESLDRPVEKGDTVLVSMDTKRKSDGEAIPNLTFASRPYAVGLQYMPDEFDNEIVGMKKGDVKTVAFQAPTLDEKGNPVSEEVETTVSLLGFQKPQKPEINDAWVKKYMPRYTSRDALVSEIAAHAIDEQSFAYNARLQKLATEEIAKRFEGSLSNEVLLNMRDGLIANLRTSLSAQGQDFDKYVSENGGEDQLNIMMLLEARRSLAEGYALDAVYRHFKLYTTDNDINAMCRQMNPQNPKSVRTSMEEGGRGFALQESAERYRAAKYLVDHATIVEPKPATESDATAE